MTFAVRRVRAGEWERAREIRLAALSDPAASVAFLTRYDDMAGQPEQFWRDRTADAAEGASTAQFIAESADEWIGTIAVIRWQVGAADHHGRTIAEPRADVVGVYVRPGRRGAGIVDALLAAAAEWAAGQGETVLTLDVHADNQRAQAAYRRAGFVETGRRFTGAIGPEIEMARALDDEGSHAGR